MKLAFKSRPAKPARGGKRKTVTITRQAKQGPVKIKLGKRRLKPGRYRLVIVAVDKSFNRSKPVAKNVNVQQTRATAKDDFEPA